jgi:hypothetical protein
MHRAPALILAGLSTVCVICGCYSSRKMAQVPTWPEPSAEAEGYYEVLITGVIRGPIDVESMLEKGLGCTNLTRVVSPWPVNEVVYSDGVPFVPRIFVRFASKEQASAAVQMFREGGLNVSSPGWRSRTNGWSQ